MKGFIFLGLCAGPMFFAQSGKVDTLKVHEIEGVSFTKKLPVTKEVINVEKDLGGKNLGQDLPILLKNQTSIISTSDAGNGVGYTGFRIRGASGTSINVMMNGVPYNDSESQGTFFVDVPDLASSASQIIIQRGVGTSSNGVSAFGASVNIVSKDPEKDFYVKTDNAYGSFNTYKVSAEVGSGKMLDNTLSFMGRYTKIHSDGYIDRASSDLASYNLTALYEKNSTRLRFMAFGGKEKTYQAWNGIDKKTWEDNPKYNPSGAIYDDAWKEVIGFYDDETDNYWQNHYQLLWLQKFNPNWKLETTLHYTKGKGYYKNYKQGKDLFDYDLETAPNVAYSDFIRKKWLDNDFYGGIINLYGKLEDVDLNFGAVANQYKGDHFGNVSGVQLTNIDQHEYYKNESTKNEVAGFTKAVVKLGDFEFFGDVQLRKIDYKTQIIKEGDDEGANMEKDWLFFNPKVGLNVRIPKGKFYFSYAHAHREPNRDDLLANSDTKAEKLHDFEMGVEQRLGRLNYGANAYYMEYENQLVLTGQINNVGAFIRANSGKSYRTGIELYAGYKVSNQIELMGNLTYSDNKNVDYKVEDNGIKKLGNTNISFSPDFIGNVRIGYTPIKNLNFALQNQYVSKQYLDNTNNDDLTTPAYYLADFNATYNFDVKRVNVGVQFLLNNIFNKKYVNNGYTWGTTPYYFAQAGTNFMLGLSLKFK